MLKVLQLPLMHSALAFEGNTGLPSCQSLRPKHRPHELVETLLGLPLPGYRAAKEVWQLYAIIGEAYGQDRLLMFA